MLFPTICSVLVTALFLLTACPSSGWPQLSRLCTECYIYFGVTSEAAASSVSALKLCRFEKESLMIRQVRSLPGVPGALELYTFAPSAREREKHMSYYVR